MSDRTQAAYDSLINRGLDILDTIELENRPLDEWEKSHLISAVSAISIGWLGVANVGLEKILTPVDQRAAGYTVADDHAVAIADFGIRQFREALGYLKSAPVRRLD